MPSKHDCINREYAISSALTYQEFDDETNSPWRSLFEHHPRVPIPDGFYLHGAHPHPKGGPCAKDIDAVKDKQAVKGKITLKSLKTGGAFDPKVVKRIFKRHRSFF